MKPSDYLKRGWCQGFGAKNKEGEPVAPEHPDASQWCIAGAACAAITTSELLLSQFLDGLFRHAGAVTAWNDTPGRTQAEVVALAEAVEKEMGLE